MMSKSLIILAMVVSVVLTGCNAINKLKYSGNDEYYANLKNIEIKSSCVKYRNKTSCAQALADRRNEARQKLNMPALYKDNLFAERIYASNEQEYIQPPVIKPEPVKPPVNNAQKTTNSNANTTPTTTPSQTEASKEKAENTRMLQISDFAEDYVIIDGMRYSTTRRDFNKTAYIKLCANAMMIDLMNSWKQTAIKNGQQNEFSQLRDRIYTGQWNALTDSLESQISNPIAKLTCDQLIRQAY